jgi:tetratricopeptide (TPR) repeat protein
MSAPEQELQRFSKIKISVFIFDPIMKRHAHLSLQALGFADVSDHGVPRNYFEALSRAVPLIAGPSELVLVNFPPKPRPKGSKDDVRPVYDLVRESYTDLKTHLAKRSSEPLQFLSKAIPVIEVGDYLREKLIEVLFKFRVPAAFFMSVPETTRHLKGASREQKDRENFDIFYREITEYLHQYFRDRDELVALADEKLSEKDLTQRKKQYDELMAEAQRLKTENSFDAAINLLRQAITIYPKDITAYLESGRLYTRRKEYSRALIRYGQAEDLFVEAPSPNKEIANVRLIQVKEKIESGADPKSPEIMAWMAEVTANCREAHAKTVKMAELAPGSPELNQPVAMGQEILKWNLAELLGHKHPAVRELHKLAGETTKGLEHLPIDELSAMQSLSLGLQAMERGNIPQARRYYFNALKDKEHFSEVCTEINLFGIRLRSRGHADEALAVYMDLLRHQPPNQGFVYWNLAIVYAYKNQALNAAGCVARSLYTDPYLPREKEFYDSLTPQLTPIVLKMMTTLKVIYKQSQAMQAPPQLVKMNQAAARLERLIIANQRSEALKLFLALAKQAPGFTVKPEFHGDGTVVRFLVGLKDQLAESPDPANQARLKTINSWLKQVTANPAPPRLVQYLKLNRAAYKALAEKADQRLAAYFLGQSLILLPDSYYARPDFFAQETLPALVRELTGKFKFVDLKRFPKYKTPTKR